MERRFKYISIPLKTAMIHVTCDRTVLNDMLKGLDIPDGTQTIQTYYDDRRKVFRCLIYNDAFTLIAEGEEIPEVKTQGA
jgi:hypothetical protein